MKNIVINSKDMRLSLSFVKAILPFLGKIEMNLCPREWRVYPMHGF